MRQTSERLANTPAVTRSSYVHPLVVEAFEEERIGVSLLNGLTRNGLDQAETALMRFLENALGKPTADAPAERNGGSRRNVTRRDARREKRPWLRRSSTTSGRSSRRSTSA